MLLYAFSEKLDKVLNPTHSYFSNFIKKTCENYALEEEGWFVVAFPKKYHIPTLRKYRNTLKQNQPQIMQFIEDFDLVDYQEDLENKGYEDIRVFSINAVSTLL